MYGPQTFLFVPQAAKKKKMESMFKTQAIFWVLVTHACNPSYSGGRDQEDLGSKPA
jgi:hypothetical protein